MKKLFAILLCIIMMLSMVACGNEQSNQEIPNNNQGNNVTPPTNEPTEEELKAISYYVSAMEELNKCVETGSMDDLWFAFGNYGIADEDGRTDVWGSEAAAEYYNLINNLNAVDKWVGTEYTNHENVNWNRQAVLDSFVVLEDVKIAENYKVYDLVGNETIRNNAITYQYDTNGKATKIKWDVELGHDYPVFVFDLIEKEPMLVMNNDNNNGVEVVYDDAGKITEGKIVKGSDTVFQGVFSYDENGNAISVVVTHKSGEKGTITYSYDAQGRISKIDYTGSTESTMAVSPVLDPSFYNRDCKMFSYVYTYDSAGNVVKEEYKDISSGTVQYEKTMDYSYDSNGNLVSAICTQNDHAGYSSTDEYAFTNDQNGRPVKATITFGNILSAEDGSVVFNAKYSKVDIECAYGDIYFYNPAN